MIIKDKKTGKEKDARLPKLFKKKWLIALRSGEFKQGSGRLQQKTGEYCCLGVACRILHPKVNLIGVGLIMAKGHLEKSYKSIKVPKILHGNMTSMSPSINYNPVVEKLVQMNDDKISFVEIADFIEENL